ncbi:MAG: hypothetical protein JW893_06225 [Candidatus Omnitrophica bacterium]|nr:hypothetical protein [Candidatus Omnitrophota bacterium]
MLTQIVHRKKDTGRKCFFFSWILLFCFFTFAGSSLWTAYADPDDSYLDIPDESLQEISDIEQAPITTVPGSTPVQEETPLDDMTSKVISSIEIFSDNDASSIQEVLVPPTVTTLVSNAVVETVTTEMSATTTAAKVWTVDCTLDVARTNDGLIRISVRGDSGDSDVLESKYVTVVCTACGDGRVDSAYEECDDGNTMDGDGCTATCVIEEPPRQARCGDGIVENNEECDNDIVPEGATPLSGDGCSSTCLEERCGNQRIDAGEECDLGDGMNGADGSTCSEDCEVVQPPSCNNVVPVAPIGDSIKGYQGSVTSPDYEINISNQTQGVCSVSPSSGIGNISYQVTFAQGVALGAKCLYDIKIATTGESCWNYEIEATKVTGLCPVGTTKKTCKKACPAGDVLAPDNHFEEMCGANNDQWIVSAANCECSTGNCVLKDCFTA